MAIGCSSNDSKTNLTSSAAWTTSYPYEFMDDDLDCTEVLKLSDDGKLSEERTFSSKGVTVAKINLTGTWEILADSGKEAFVIHYLPEIEVKNINLAGSHFDLFKDDFLMYISGDPDGEESENYDESLIIAESSPEKLILTDDAGEQQFIYTPIK